MMQARGISIMVPNLNGIFRPRSFCTASATCMTGSWSRSSSPLPAGPLGDGDRDAHVGEFAQELVERRVDQPHHDGQAVHGLVHLAEVALLERKQLVEGALTRLDGVREDHL